YPCAARSGGRGGGRARPSASHWLCRERPGAGAGSGGRAAARSPRVTSGEGMSFRDDSPNYRDRASPAAPWPWIESGRLRQGSPWWGGALRALLVYLTSHYLTDVIGGILLGAAWTHLCQALLLAAACQSSLLARV